MVKIGINGFGRIGRCVLRIAVKNPEVEVVAVNARSGIDTYAHLLKYDSIHGIFDEDVSVDGDIMHVGDKAIKFTRFNSPAEIPWGDMGVDVVLETTGKFKTRETVQPHLDNGAKKVIIAAPAKGEDITMVMGVNDDKYDPKHHNIISNASCTTNCLAPFTKVLQDNFGIEDGMMTTVHSYTNDQKILDAAHKDLRRARAGACSIIPTTTGAAKAIGLVLPELQGKLKGMAIRVPTPDVSLTDLVVNLKKDTTKEEINEAMRVASETTMKGILGYNELPLVSCDYSGCPLSSIVDGLSTMMVGPRMAKVVSWYDNEWGYSNRMVDMAVFVASKGL